MYCITVALKDNPAVWTLMFQNKRSCRVSMESISG